MCVGQEFTNKKGLGYVITEYLSTKKIKIKFLESGFERFAEYKEVKSGSVKDTSLYLKAGDEVINSAGRKATVLNRFNSNKVEVLFEDGFTGIFAEASIRNGAFKDRSHYFKAGDQFTNTEGSRFEILEIRNFSEVVIRYLDEKAYETVVTTNNIKLGRVKNPYHPQIFGKGFMGVGPYSSTHESGRGNCRQRTLWGNMLMRCYDEEQLVKGPTYSDCIVEEHFLNYQNFAPWCEKQVGWEYNDWCLDKDILKKGNKIYSRELCVFVPREINNLFTSRVRFRGDFPLGVYWCAVKERYVSQCNINGKRTWLGYFGNPEEAFLVYKQAKERHIKEVAETWKDKIDPRVYDALNNWTIEVTD